MNRNQVLFGAAIFALGIGIGWFSRGTLAGTGGGEGTAGEPVSQKSVGAPAAPAASGAAPTVAQVVGKRAIRDAAPKKAADAPDPEEIRKIQEQVSKGLASRQRAKFEQYIAKLAEALSLTDSQKAALGKWLDERVARIETMDFTDPSSMTDPGGMADLFSNKALEEELAKTLTAEQQSSLAGFKERETRAKVDAMALKSLSQMQGVFEFEEGQRDAVYKILTDAAEEKLKKQATNPDTMGYFAESMGIEMDPYDLGVHDAMQDAFKSAGTAGGVPDQKTMASAVRKVIDERISAKVDLLRPVLNDKQLEQYRTELKNKGAGLMGTAWIGEDAGDGDAGPAQIMVPVK